MVELKSKVTLKEKGAEAYVSLKQLMVTLSWRSSVDLDLMAFYKAKDGRVGGVYSENYQGGSLGNLNNFPFIELSGDAGVGAKGGENEETLRITKLDDLAELYICTVNFTDAVKNQAVSFNNYDGRVTVLNDRGEAIEVPLDASQQGTVAVIARIDNSNMMGPKLINENTIMDWATFQSTVPGAANVNLGSKIVLKAKGDSVTLKPKGDNLGMVTINLNWNQGKKNTGGGLLGRMLGGGGGSSIDLDLACLFELTNGTKGVVQALGNSFGAKDRPPYIWLSGDDRTGSSTDGEFIYMNGQYADQIKRLLVFTFIYEGARNWSQTDALITIKSNSMPDIAIELDEHRDGMIMASLGLIENIGGAFKIQKDVRYFNGHQELDQAFRWGLNWVAGRK